MAQNSKHLNFIRSLPCLICGNNIETEACHVRMSDARIAKPESGLGRKPPDWFTVPMCGRHHKEQHQQNERTFWDDKGIDPILTSLALYAESGNYQKGIDILKL